MSKSIMDWMDQRCIACKGPMPQPTWSGQPYICCSGNDCGCYGAVLPLDFCSVACYENYDPTPWCSGCGAMKKSNCHCGPLAAND